MLSSVLGQGLGADIAGVPGTQSHFGSLHCCRKAAQIILNRQDNRGLTLARFLFISRVAFGIPELCPSAPAVFSAVLLVHPTRMLRVATRKPLTRLQVLHGMTLPHFVLIGSSSRTGSPSANKATIDPHSSVRYRQEQTKSDGKEELFMSAPQSDWKTIRASLAEIGWFPLFVLGLMGFSILLTYEIARPTVESMYQDLYGSENEPWAWLGVALLVTLVVGAYSAQPGETP